MIGLLCHMQKKMNSNYANLVICICKTYLCLHSILCYALARKTAGNFKYW